MSSDVAIPLARNGRVIAWPELFTFELAEEAPSAYVALLRDAFLRAVLQPCWGSLNFTTDERTEDNGIN